MKGRKMKAAVIETGPDIREAWVDAPLASWAQFLHEMERGVPHAGRERAMVDRRTLMGGFCRFHGTEAQEKAAAKFKAIYERSQVGGAKAVDPSKEAVDGGGINPESVIEIGSDARRAYNEMHLKFGRQFMMHIEFVVVGDHGPTAYARWLHRGRVQSGQETGRCAVEFRRMMEQLAVHLKLQTRAA
jgi:hypothetical protein